MHFRLTGVGNDFTFELRGLGPHIVGRGVTSECPVIDPTVSRTHATLTLTEHGIEITDAGSSNGTFINGEKLEPRRYYQLLQKDCVKFGASTREYVLLAEDAAGAGRR